MQKISTFVLTDEISTKEVLKLFVSEFDNLEINEAPQEYADIVECFSDNDGKSILIIDLSSDRQSKLDLMLKKIYSD